MQLYDTCIWLEWRAGSVVGRKFNHQFENLESCIVPTLVQFELYRWHLRARSEQEAEEILAFTMSAIVTPLDSATAVRAAELSRQHKLHAADAIVYATALALGATLFTCDSHFKGLPNVDYSEK